MSYRTSIVALPVGDASSRARLSSGKSSGEMSGAVANNVVEMVAPRVFRPEDMRREFPDQWADWCCANFRDSVQLAAAFRVSEKTARLWMQRVNAPQGWAVVSAMQGLIEGVEPFVPDLGVAA